MTTNPSGKDSKEARRNEFEREISLLAKELAKQLRCNCDLDNWEPQKLTGHSHVCRIHQQTISQYRQRKGLGT